MFSGTSRLMTASEYLAHAYEIPSTWPDLPMEDEAFVASWKEAKGEEVLFFLGEVLGLDVKRFSWENREGLSIAFARTLGGKLPVLSMAAHCDFRQMEALLNGREAAEELPLTVNAFALVAKAERIARHRVLLLNWAPYSNIPAERLGLSEEDWLERSYRLRLAHECAHYETLRLLGGMRNHALDEILADALGQIAAFGEFDADRQRLFFGIAGDRDTCTGRLSFYCRKVLPEERSRIYHAVDVVLDPMAEALRELSARNAAKTKILAFLAGTSIAERLELYRKSEEDQ